MTDTLFLTLPPDASEYYRALYEPQHPRNVAIREQCDEHWRRFRPLADEQFPARFPIEFHQRWFEMYVGVTLLDMGLDVTAPKPGPDFLVQRDGVRVWIEAVVPDGGHPMHPDAVSEPPLVLPGAPPIARFVPKNAMALRIAQAVTRKIGVFDRYRADRRVNRDDACVIAVSVRGVPGAWTELQDLLVRTLYGVGDEFVNFNLNADESVPTEWGRYSVEGLTRQGGAAEDALAMVRPENAAISAVLGSNTDAANLPAWLGNDFMLCPHVRPAVPLPAGLLPRGQEWLIQPDGDGFKGELVSHLHHI